MHSRIFLAVMAFSATSFVAQYASAQNSPESAVGNTGSPVPAPTSWGEDIRKFLPSEERGPSREDVMAGAKVFYKSKSGRIAEIRANDPRVGLPLPAGPDPALLVEGFLTEHSLQLGLDNELRNLVREKSERYYPGITFTFAQQLEGLKVFFTKLAVAVGEKDGRYFIRKVISNIQPITESLPVKSREYNIAEVERVIDRDLEQRFPRLPSGPTRGLLKKAPVLGILVTEGKPRRAWQVYREVPGSISNVWYFFVDADSLEIISGSLLRTAIQ